jgi:phosphogluconate dehydratase
MPELHKLTPALGVLQDAGYKVALVTDGRMSGASGKVPAAIHVSPECVDGGALARVRDGDIIRLDANAGELNVVADNEDWLQRESITVPEDTQLDCGRNLFRNMRAVVSTAETGALSLFNPGIQ